MRYRTLLFVGLSMLVLMAACGADDRGRQPAAEDASGNAVAVATTDAADGTRTFAITPVGNEMKFEQTEIRARAGETIRIVFDNTATSPAMHHNVLLVSDRGSINEVGRAAMNAATREYIPDHPAIIAATPMAAPGESVEVTFTVPAEAGEYPYICTYPGHYVLMQGTLRVTS